MTEILAYIQSNPIAQGLIFFLFSLVAIRILAWFVKVWVVAIVKNTKTDVDDILLDKLQTPVIYFLILASAKATIRIMHLHDTTIGISDKILHSLMILVAAYIVISVADVSLRVWVCRFAEKTRSRKDEEVLRLFHRVIAIVGYILAILFILQYWGISVGPLFASLGIAGIAIAFALQDSLGNILGGIQLILDDVIRKGDVLKLEDGTEGKVINVGIRTTRIESFNHEEIIVPNKQLANEKIINYNKPDDKIRIEIPFGVEYGSDPDKVMKVAVDSLKGIKEVLDDPAPHCQFVTMGESSLNFTLKFWLPKYDLKYDRKREEVRLLYKALNKNKIGIPFPTRTVYLKK